MQSEFQELQDPLEKLSADWNSISGWSRCLTSDWHVEVRFKALAERAGKAMNPDSSDPLVTWLDGLRRIDPTYDEIWGILTLNDGEVAHIGSGRLSRLREASVTLCSVLRAQASIAGPAPAAAETPKIEAEHVHLKRLLKKLCAKKRITQDTWRRDSGFGRSNLALYLSGAEVPPTTASEYKG